MMYKSRLNNALFPRLKIVWEYFGAKCMYELHALWRYSVTCAYIQGRFILQFIRSAGEHIRQMNSIISKRKKLLNSQVVQTVKCLCIDGTSIYHAQYSWMLYAPLSSVSSNCMVRVTSIWTKFLLQLQCIESKWKRRKFNFTESDLKVRN